MSSKNDAHWYPRHYKDYQIDTSHLSMLEHGAYTLLLDQYYLQGKPLIADAMALARQVRCMTQSENDAMRSVLEQFFVLEDDGWHNKRADEEITKRAQLIEKKRNSGAVGAQKRWHSPSAIDGTCHNIRHGKPNAHTQSHTHTQKTVRTLVAADESTATGSAVWDAYATEYANRYGVAPVRNAKSNALCKQLVARLGADAPQVAAFFVRHSKQFYVLKGHQLTALIGDAETLRTEWATGRRVTATSARQADRTQSTGDVFAALISEQGGNA
jgi:uncharacterized protein YdaU (DUF1376 family)